MQDALAVDVIDAGSMAYQPAWELQESLHEKCVADHNKAYLVMVEHPNVLTVGYNAGEESVLASEDWLVQNEVVKVTSTRGGDATLHMPGQLVVYPILPLTRMKLSVRSYVCALQKVVISLLAKYDIEAGTDSSYPGVWVGDRKICAVGIRVSRRVSMHGIALNVSNNLDLFSAIVPCGIQGRGVTSMAALMHKTPALAEVKSRFLQEFLRTFSLRESLG